MSNSAGRGEVLLIVKEAVSRKAARAALEFGGFIVTVADDLRGGLVDAASRGPSLVVVDLDLSRGEGLDLIRDLRALSDAPLIALSSRDNQREKVTALDAGAVDYLVKPFGRDELCARVRAHLRHCDRGVEGCEPPLIFGDLAIDFARRTVVRAGEPVRLTRTEYRILAYLAAHAGFVVTHSQLLEAVWGPDHANDAHYLRVYIHQVRRKIEVDTSKPRHLITEIGVGYRLVAQRRGKQECSERDGKSETPSLSIGAIGRKPARSKALNRLRSKSVPSRYDTR